jgi:hypothetical protein
VLEAVWTPSGVGLQLVEVVASLLARQAYVNVVGLPKHRIFTDLDIMSYNSAVREADMPKRV